MEAYENDDDKAGCIEEQELLRYILKHQAYYTTNRLGRTFVHMCPVQLEIGQRLKKAFGGFYGVVDEDAYYGVHPDTYRIYGEEAEKLITKMLPLLREGDPYRYDFARRLVDEDN